MTGVLAPYDGPRAVGLVESYRLGREERMRNAELERMSGGFALAEARRNLDALARRGEAARAHHQALEDQRHIVERAGAAVTFTGALVDHAIEVTAGDQVKATYIEPILSAASLKLRQTI